MYIRNVAKQKRKNAFVKKKYADQMEVLDYQIREAQRRLEYLGRKQKGLMLEQQKEMYDGLSREQFVIVARSDRTWVEGEWTLTVALRGYRLGVRATTPAGSEELTLELNGVSYVGHNPVNFRVIRPSGSERRYALYEVPKRYEAMLSRMREIMTNYQIIEEG